MAPICLNVHVCMRLKEICDVLDGTVELGRTTVDCVLVSIL